MLLIGRKPKLSSECTKYDEDFLKNPDFTEEEVEMLSQVVTEDNFHNLVKMRDTVFDNSEANIKKTKKYEIRNA